MDSREGNKQQCTSRKVKKLLGVLKLMIYLIRLGIVLEKGKTISHKFAKVPG